MTESVLGNPYVESLWSSILSPSVSYDAKKDLVSIRGVNINRVINMFRDLYKSPGFATKFFSLSMFGTINLPQFFIPEIVYILDQCVRNYYISAKVYNGVLEGLYHNTWYASTKRDIPTICDIKVFDKEIKRKPRPYQLDFIQNIYYQKKTQYHLKGYLLALPQGAGKSFTSLSLAGCLKKKHILIIAPLSVALNSWPQEIENTFVTKKEVVGAKDNISDIKSSTDVVITNYEGVSKLEGTIIEKFEPDDTIIIVDECHNYKDIYSKRTQELIRFTQNFQCNDILLMSGTPVFATTLEAMPIFSLLDDFYTPVVEDILKSLGRFPGVMNSLVHHRLGTVTYRKEASEIMPELPEKVHKDILIKLPNGKKYTNDEVKTTCVKYFSERVEYYQKNFDKYEKIYKDCLTEFEKVLTSKMEENRYKRYRADVETIKSKEIKSMLSVMGGRTGELIISVNKYENEVIIPNLPVHMRKPFRESKSVYRYYMLKCMGETLGTVLSGLRAEMYSALIGEEIHKIIDEAEKKTIIFSTQNDVLEIAMEKCKSWNMNPVLINGSNSKDAKSILDKFKKNKSLNPLVCSVQVMGAGHTIIEANTVIFVGKPWRQAMVSQAEDRVWRIGQDASIVNIISVMLDTDGVPNLSTHLEDIVQWSREQFEEIVIGTKVEDSKKHAEVSKEINNQFNKAINSNSDVFDNIKGFVNKICNILK